MGDENFPLQSGRVFDWTLGAVGQSVKSGQVGLVALCRSDPVRSGWSIFNPYPQCVCLHCRFPSNDLCEIGMMLSALHGGRCQLVANHSDRLLALLTACHCCAVMLVSVSHVSLL